MLGKNKLIVALDVEDFNKANSLIDLLCNEVEIFKVGIAPFTDFGHKILEKIESVGKKVFLDLKVHDIPNTVYNAAKAAAKHDVFMMNFHCSGGKDMLESAVKGAIDGSCGKKEKPILLGVTVLTSMGQKEISGIGFKDNVEKRVIDFAKIAKKAGLNGVVASAKEAHVIKENISKDFIVVTPAVRPIWSTKEDQKRVVTPKQAIKEGADYIVVGRPIIGSNDPVDAARKIIKEMEETFESCVSSCN